jgi:hypothetical protein
MVLGRENVRMVSIANTKATLSLIVLALEVSEFSK